MILAGPLPPPHDWRILSPNHRAVNERIIELFRKAARSSLQGTTTAGDLVIKYWVNATDPS